MKLPIYLDYAATCPVDERVAKKMMEYLTIDGVFGNPASRSHKFGWQAEEAVDIARNQIADLIGADSREIVFTSGATEADNLAIKGAAHFYQTKGKHIITCKTEHKAVLDTCRQLEREGFEVTYLDPEEDGLIDLEKFKAALRPETILVSIMHVNNEIGVIQDIKAIGELCRANKTIFHVDATQSVGKVEINLAELPVDLMSMSSHKLYGPKGIGALYVKRGIELTSLMEGGGQERGKRPGTENLPAIMGMAAALKEECTLMEQNEAKVTAMRDRLIQGLSQIPYSILNGSREKRLPGNVNFCFEGVSGESLLLLLDSRGICASSGSACASGALDPSHVLLSLGLAPEIAQGSLRISLDISNTEEEIDYMLEVIPQVVEQLRGMSDDWRKKHCED